MNKLNLKCQLLIGLVAFNSAFLPALADDSVELESTESKSAPLLAAALPSSNVHLSQQADEAAKLLGIESQVRQFIDLKNSGKLEAFDKEALRLQLFIIRRILTSGLELRTVSAKLDKEITLEQQALDKLSRERDFVVAQTNNANFFQLNILSTIIDGPLAQTRHPQRIVNSNQLNIVSGLTVGALALVAFAEQRGGIRHGKAETNMLAQPLGLDAPSSERFPPMLWTYLNSPAPSSEAGLTRRELLIEYWKTAKVLPININKPATVEKVSVLGPRHTKWSETIKLLTGRVTMLFDLRAMVDLLNTGLVELLQAMD